MKRSITIGAYGWRHPHWWKNFYPDDLPATAEDDWRLAYYSNEFETVLVPADYWQQVVDCERWLDDVNDEFQFFVECHGGLFEQVSMAEITKQLKILRPQLSALVILQSKQKIPQPFLDQLCDLAQSLMIDVFADTAIDSDLQIKNIWQQEQPHRTELALIEDDLTDLRSARTIIDAFVSQSTHSEQENKSASVIVNHPKLRAMDLSRFRAALEIMGH